MKLAKKGIKIAIKYVQEFKGKHKTYNGERENIKKNDQIELLEMKNAISKVDILLHGIREFEDSNRNYSKRS